VLEAQEIEGLPVYAWPMSLPPQAQDSIPGGAARSPSGAGISPARNTRLILALQRKFLFQKELAGISCIIKNNAYMAVL